MFCKYCGKEIKDDENFCPYCGNKIDRTNQETTTNNAQYKSKLVAALLAIFAGQYGAHNFYLKNKKIALLQLLTTLLLITVDITFFFLKINNLIEPQIYYFMYGLFSTGRALIKTWTTVEFVLILCNKILDENGNLLK